jgi:drug/metabolite transporter (DMT)-like permease
MRIPLIAAIGWWLYGERVDAYVLLGAGLIITGILWNLRSEAGRRRTRSTPADDAPKG